MGTQVNRIELQDDGTHYYRADFQVHTPRDTNWDGPRPKTEDERIAVLDTLAPLLRKRAALP